MELITAYPVWYLWTCVLGGFGLAFFLYYKAKLPEHKPFLRYFLFALRWLAMILLIFLLFNPFIKTEKRFVEKPIVVFANDNSESVLINKDSSFYKKEFPTKFQGLANQVNEKLEVKNYTFGESLKDSLVFDYQDKVTNYKKLLHGLEERYANQNVGAIVIASDGLYNQGSNPIYAINKLKTPVYAIALGDTSPQKDLLIKTVRNNSIAYLGNDFPINLEIEANDLDGQTASIELSRIDGKNTKILDKQNVAIKGKYFTAKFDFTAEANKSGVQHYRIRLKGISGEVSYGNNVKNIFIEVLDNKNKILLLARSPHPDLSAIKQALQKNKNLEIKTQMIQDFDGEFKSYNLVVLHQLPGLNQGQQELINKIKKEEIPIWYILGKQSDLNVFNAVQKQIKVTAKSNLTSQSQAALTENFALFNLSENVNQHLINFPPLDVPFGDYNPSISHVNLLNQKIGAIKTEMPLLSFGTGLDYREAFMFGEGLWKWHLAEYEENKSHEALNEILNKTVQYLTVKQDKRPFRVKKDKNIYNENEEIIFYGELYNQSYELVNEPDVQLKIKSDGEQEFNYILSKTGDKYFLNAGSLPSGNYRYTAQTSYNGEAYRSSGSFSVKSIDLEGLTTRANHQLLHQLASNTGGKVFYPNELQALKDSILNREDVRPVVYYQSSVEEIINWRWILLVIGFLIALEWFIRKYIGGY